MILRDIFQQEKDDLEEFSMLLVGKYDTFKTYLAGAMLQVALNKGKSILFVDIEDEDGIKTLRNFPDVYQPKHGVRIQTTKDLEDLIKELEVNKIDAGVFDGGKVLGDAMSDRYVGDELPKTSSESIAKWWKLGRAIPSLIKPLRRCFKRFIFTCPAKLHLDNLSQSDAKAKKSEMDIVPALPGQSAGNAIGWFDYVGYCEMKPTQDRRGVRRLLHFERIDQIDTRARLVRQMKKPIELPEGGGAQVWTTVEDALNAHFTLEDK